MVITWLSLVVMIVSQRKHLFWCVCNCSVFVFMPRSPPLSSLTPPCSSVQPPESPIFWSVSLLTRVRRLAGVLQVTQRDVISNRCHAFICSAGAWRGQGIMSWSPWTLVHAASERREAGEQTERHTWVFTEGQMLQFCNGVFTEMS